MTDSAPRSFLARSWPVLAGIVGALIVVTFIGGRILYRPFSAPSASMEPTINVGDFFLGAQFAYGNAAPARGDVIVFHGLRGDDYIKRVVGLPGDHVQMINGVLYINKKGIAKKRVADFAETDALGTVSHVQQFEEILPGGKSYLVLDRGDSDEDNTNDFAVPPDSYFVLGDNRDNSDDSRMSFGYIRRADIIGRASTIYFSGGKLVWRDIR